MVSEPRERPPTALWSARREGRVVRLRGDVDVFTADDIEDRLVGEVADGADQLDLSEVDFFGLAGVRVLRAGADTARLRGGELEVLCPPPVLRLLEICGVADDDVWCLSPLAVSGNGHGGENGHRP